MLFKQIQLFDIKTRLATAAENIATQLHDFAFHPCFASSPISMGWVSPLEEDDAPLAIGLQNCIMICLQIEKKILPNSVINDALKTKIKEVEKQEGRKIRQKEKLSYKEEVTQTLLPRAFSKYTKIFAYIDIKHKWLVLNTTNPAQTELFLSLFKKSIAESIAPIDTLKPSLILSDWLMNHSNPTSFSVQKACVLQDPQQENRVIRATQQDLFAPGIQALLKEGCQAIQLACCWQDRIHFTITQPFQLRSLKYASDELSEISDQIDTVRQKFSTDFILMVESLTQLIKDLLEIFETGKQTKKEKLALVG
ncbi:MAG TPA: recombination-associated protein RdgC [Gammaproteobacteria bacterium]|jgi:recombination associated protein RdgC|nr:recombination-associated protein RdgC [Gammaproteobacteria bacterium]